MAARARSGARNGRSSRLGLAGALEMAARARSALLGRSKWPLEPARLCWGARQRCSGLLGFAGAFKFSARTRSASKGARNGRSSLLGFAGASEIAAQACSVGLAGALDNAAQAHSDGETCEKLFENAVLGSRLALNTWLCSSMLRAWICSGPR